jgi:hypothetical protein
MFIGCGKRKSPLPPIERVPQRVEISGSQRGNKIYLTWTMPVRNANVGNLLNISRADIYRLAEPLNSPLTLSEEEFASKSTLIGTVAISFTDFAAKQITFADTLDFAGQSSRLRYAIRFANASGQKAQFSNFLLIEPTAKVAENPKEFKLNVTQNAIVLEWLPPDANVDGSKPANILGYNLYRIDNSSKTVKLLNTAPITKTIFNDDFFEFEKDYTYFLRTVSLGVDAAPIESQESDSIIIIPKDTFPPTPPSAITIAASPNSISIFFATNPEKDVVGYKLYRSTDVNKPKSDWTLMTEEILKTNTFQDTNVESGITYYYYLTAVDKFGNTSEFSDIVRETVP